MALSILFFASLKDRSGTNRFVLETARPLTVSALKDQLGERYPAIKLLLPNCLVAINQQFAFNEDLVPESAEVAFFPPVSGGSGGPTVLKIVEGALDLDELVAAITLPTTGAACVFTGMVRGITQRDDPHETVSLEYEAYQPMAEAKMSQVAEEIRQRWPAVEGIALVQRVGHLLPGTPTVLIACSAGHRDTGVFEAARYGIDRLKEIVPVWKKEISPTGEVWVEGKYHPKPGD
jgi:molybdopterin synthase catalytic subunit/molybdopterin converting factor small subunit